jgi:hypothetical protein
MKIFNYGKEVSRDEYKNIQIERSRAKFNYSRISVLDILVKMNILKNNAFSNGPIICMGVRNGREINLFRAVQNRFISKIIYLFELKKYGFSSLLFFIEKYFKQNNIKNIEKNGIYGVELNPDLVRKDVYIGSFDELPSNFENQFEVVYSNSFDQSINPTKTAGEWIRILKNNGFMIIDWVENDEATYTDPTGGILKEDILSLFKGEVISYSKNGNFDTQGNSSTIIIQIKK